MDWQMVIALIVVAASAALAIRFLGRKFFSKPQEPDCEDTACKGCPVSETCHSDKKEED